ncbi:hypothetical protein K0M31_020339, partial [Melipona bicolor]
EVSMTDKRFDETSHKFSLDLLKNLAAIRSFFYFNEGMSRKIRNKGNQVVVGDWTNVLGKCQRHDDGWGENLIWFNGKFAGNKYDGKTFAKYIVKQSFTLVGSDMEMKLMESQRGLRFIERTTIQTATQIERNTMSRIKCRIMKRAVRETPLIAYN